MERAAEKMKGRVNRKKAEAREYAKGEKVWLEATNLKTTQPSRKLAAKRLGPFEVEEKVGKSAYRLKLPLEWKIHPVFNELLLTPYHPPVNPTQPVDERPPPDIVGDVQEFEVEEITGARLRGRGLQFLVKWKGYPVEESTWEPERNLANAEDAKRRFYAQNSGAPWWISAKLCFMKIPNDPSKGLEA